MKKVLLLAAFAGIVFSGCTEIGPPINFTKGTATNKDTIYTVSPVPAAQPHQVLIEEFTGQSCSNCPAAHAQLEGYEAQYPGLVNVVGLYIYNFPQTIPPTGAAYDFRDSAATTIGSTIYGAVGEMPVAGIDRITSGNNYATTGDSLQFNTNDWGTYIASQLLVTDPLNISVSSSYNSTTDSATITVSVTYVSTVTATQNLSIYIVEDSMYDLQDSTDVPSPVTLTHYLFTNVLRNVITYVPTGDPLMVGVATKNPGMTEQRIYTTGLNSKWIPAHCRVIAFVNNAAEPYGIIQSVQCKLAP